MCYRPLAHPGPLTGRLAARGQGLPSVSPWASARMYPPPQRGFLALPRPRHPPWLMLLPGLQILFTVPSKRKLKIRGLLTLTPDTAGAQEIFADECVCIHRCILGCFDCFPPSSCVFIRGGSFQPHFCWSRFHLETRPGG